MEKISTEFGVFTENLATKQTAQEVFESWRSEYCVLENNIWRRKTPEELLADTDNIQTTEEKIRTLKAEVTRLDGIVAELMLLI